VRRHFNLGLTNVPNIYIEISQYADKLIFDTNIMSDILTFSKALADETRLRLVAILLAHELAVGEIVQALSLKQSRISRHLKILADSGLLNARRDGQWVFYRAADSGKGCDYLKHLTPFFEGDEIFEADVSAATHVVASRAVASARFFDGIAGDWERMRAEALGDLDLAAEIKHRMGTVSAAADLGCGPGRLLGELATGAKKVIGVDNAQGMLDEARDYLNRTLKNGAATSLRIGQLEHLPLSDGEVQFAVMCLALHHLSEPEKGIREARRVLAAGGRFVLADFDKHENEKMRTKLGDRWLGFAPDEIDTWLTEAGFNINETVLFPLPSGLNLRLVVAEKLH